MKSLKVDFKILKIDNLKLMNAKSYQEDINELILRNLTDPQKNNGQKSCSTRKKRKKAVRSGSSEENTSNIYVPTRDMKKNKDIKSDKRKEQPV